jgi:cytochrome c oxidase assembly protein subunit 11
MKTERANRRMLVRLSIFAVAMFGFGFALVPFYEKICEVTGINNLIKPAAAVENTQIDKSRWVTLEFDANSHGLKWDFRPVQRSVRVHPGEMIQVEYEVKNNDDKAIVGQAIPSYGPKHSAPFVKKLECFCFSQQPLQAGEGKRMPVQFVIDSALPADLNTITLSYTFFEVKGASTAPAKSGGQG